MDNLSAEVKKMILDFLTPEQLINFRAVDQGSYRLINSFHEFQNGVEVDVPVTSNTLPTTLGNGWIRNMCLKQCNISEDVGNLDFLTLHPVSKLLLSHCQMTENALSSILKQLQVLQELKLEKCLMETVGGVLVDFDAVGSKLTKLTLDVKNINSFAPLLKSTRNLNQLDIRIGKLDYNGLFCFEDLFKATLQLNVQYLKVLTINGTLNSFNAVLNGLLATKALYLTSFSCTIRPTNEGAEGMSTIKLMEFFSKQRNLFNVQIPPLRYNTLKNTMVLLPNGVKSLSIPCPGILSSQILDHFKTLNTLTIEFDTYAFDPFETGEFKAALQLINNDTVTELVLNGLVRERFIFPICASFHSITRLHMDGSTNGWITNWELQKVLTSFPMLTSLKLGKYSGLTDSSITNVPLTTMSELGNHDFYKALDSNIFKTLSKSRRRLPLSTLGELKNLELCDTSIGDIGVGVGIDFPKLKSLKLLGCQVGPWGIIQVVKNNTMLEKIEIRTTSPKFDVGILLKQAQYYNNDLGFKSFTVKFIE